MKRLQQQQPESAAFTALSESRMDRDYAEAFTRGTGLPLRRIVNMSASYFSRKFKQAIGINFVEYVARTRIEKARNLLQNPHLRVSKIAFEVAFQSLSQFNRAFKKVTGRVPGDYRQSLAGQAAEVHRPRKGTLGIAGTRLAV